MLSVERKERMMIPSLFCDSPKKNNLKINWNRKRDISGNLLFVKKPETMTMWGSDQKSATSTLSEKSMLNDILWI